MPAPEGFEAFIRPLEESGLPYCLTGSLASGVYGEPRSTVDADFVVLLQISDIGRLRAAFPDNEYYVPPTETLLLEARRGERGMFNLIHNASLLKADIFIASRDPLHRWALEHRRRGKLEVGEVWVAPPEYVILRKLEYYREGQRDKHRRDVAFMLACTEIDGSFLDAQIERLGLREQWLACQPNVG
jgi:hypothetical protein